MIKKYKCVSFIVHYKGLTFNLVSGFKETFSNTATATALYLGSKLVVYRLFVSVDITLKHLTMICLYVAKPVRGV